MSDSDTELGPTDPMVEARRRFQGGFGTDDEALQNRLLSQVLPGLFEKSEAEQENAVCAAIAALEALAPTDGAEGLLATQMVATHEAAMECLRRASVPGQSFAARDMNFKHAEKLMQIYSRQLEVLDKRKGRGQQKITVEHVTVEAGGQAIMGDVHVDKKGAPPGPALLSDDSVPPLDPAILRAREAVPAKARQKRSG